MEEGIGRRTLQEEGGKGRGVEKSIFFQYADWAVHQAKFDTSLNRVRNNKSVEKVKGWRRVDWLNKCHFYMVLQGG